MQSLTYEPLLEFNLMQPTSAPVPWLASAYQWSDGGGTLTFTIRPGVKFSDGKPMTAADVAFTFNLLMKNSALASSAPGPTRRQSARPRRARPRPCSRSPSLSTPTCS